MGVHKRDPDHHARRGQPKVVKQAEEVARNKITGATSESTGTRFRNRRSLNTQARHTVTAVTSAHTPRSTEATHVAKRSKCSLGLASQAWYVATATGFVKSKHGSRLMPSNLHNQNVFLLFMHQHLLAGYPEYLSVLNASSKRVRVAAKMKTIILSIT